MTVNERLWVSGLFDAYYKAVDRKDIQTMTTILKRVHLDQRSIDMNVSIVIEGK